MFANGHFFVIPFMAAPKAHIFQTATDTHIAIFNCGEFAIIGSLTELNRPEQISAPFLNFCLLVFMRDTYGPTTRHLFL